MSQPRILMCPPDFYGIEYEINPWMDRTRASDHALATRQWNDLAALLRGLGVQIELLEPVRGLPDLVFTANAGLVLGDHFYSARFRHGERARESPVFERWFAAHGFQVTVLPEDLFHEGAGDALFCGDELFAGYRLRSDVHAHQWLARQIGARVLPLELVDPRFYHLDTCFCPVEPGLAIWFPPAFDEYGRKVIETHVPRRIAVREEEAIRFACNAVVVGKTVVANAGCPDLEAQLRGQGFATLATPLDEFLKAGGSAKCLTLRLDGEEALRFTPRRNQAQ